MRVHSRREALVALIERCETAMCVGAARIEPPVDQQAVALGDNGLIHGARQGKVYFDLSTNSPTLLRHIHEEFAKVGAHVLDAPVSGGPRGARSGRLAIWVGGGLPVLPPLSPKAVRELRKHQRYLPVRDQMGGLLPTFITVANGACDPDVVRAGNEAVLRARYEDAAFFWRADLETKPLAHKVGLEKLTFEERLGSMGERAERIAALAGWLVVMPLVLLAVVNLLGAIEEVKSDTSIMPEGLLNQLTREEILDLLAFVFARGDRNHPLFQEGCGPGAGR